MNIEERVTKLFRVRKTVLTMLKDRGYSVTKEELDETKEEFRLRFGEDPSRQQMTIQKEKKNNPAEQIFVFFPDEAKVGVKTIKQYAEKMKSEDVMRAIVVVQVSLTPFAKQCLAEMAPAGFHIEQFQDCELLVNITKHALVPTHSVLSPAEQDKVLQHYKVKKEQLPRMQVTDPVARYYGMRRDQIVKIIRPSETAGRLPGERGVGTSSSGLSSAATDNCCQVWACHGSVTCG
eukprot:jgi/Mesvir1/4603/Mv15828-RA.1